MWLARSFGWRTAFCATVVPGPVLALLVLKLVRDLRLRHPVTVAMDAEVPDVSSAGGLAGALRRRNIVTEVVGLDEGPDVLLRMAAGQETGQDGDSMRWTEQTVSWRSDLFDGRTVLVMGGTSGIGAGAALRFAELGADVLAVGLDAGGSHSPKHHRVRVAELDATDADAVAALMAGVTALDVLVCCAGISRDRQEYDLEVFARVLAVNLVATMRTAEAARPLLAESRGSVVTTASMYSYFGAADRPAYSASKGGIAQLTRSLAAEYARDGIRVNAIAPGWIDTPLSKGLQADPEAGAAVLDRMPMGRWGTPADVADAYVFLASPAAAYVTGVVLPVDGGYLTV